MTGKLADMNTINQFGAHKYKEPGKCGQRDHLNVAPEKCDKENNPDTVKNRGQAGASSRLDVRAGSHDNARQGEASEHSRYNVSRALRHKFPVQLGTRA